MAKLPTSELLEQAFERLKNGCPERIRKPYKINPSTVQKEAGFSLGTMTKDKHSVTYNKVKNYKRELAETAKRDQELEEISPENQLRNRFKIADELRGKYYEELQEKKAEIKRWQAREAMVLKAMFDLLPEHKKILLIECNVTPIHENQKSKSD